MILEVVKYGHPVLRQKGVRIETITPELKALIGDMFETMHAAQGVGLAAQQVGRALQLTVLDVRGAAKDRPSSLELDGKPADVDAFMPLVLINPELKPDGKEVSGGEGCLSFPEVFAEITRPEFVEVSAMNQKGERIQFRCGGLLSRAIQHEADHLNGILFIDRMDKKTKEELKPELVELQAATKAALLAAKGK
jgi:peptide deformylase